MFFVETPLCISRNRQSTDNALRAFFLFSFHTCTWFWRISCLRWTFCKYLFNQTRLDLYIRTFEDLSVTGVHLEDAEVNFVRSAGVSIKSILFSYCSFQALSVLVCRLCHPGKSSYTCLHTCAFHFAYSTKRAANSDLCSDNKVCSGVSVSYTHLTLPTKRIV